MRNAVTAAIALLAIACSSSSATPAPTLDGNWIYTDSTGAHAVGLTLTSGKYSSLIIDLTSNTTGIAQAEVGTFKTSGSTIMFSPEEFSCPGDDPPYSGTYSLNGNTLDLAFPTAVYGMQRNNAPASSNFQVAIGCFLTSGFVASPLAPVGAADAGTD